jgi:hypothetical protein
MEIEERARRKNQRVGGISCAAVPIADLQVAAQFQWMVGVRSPSLTQKLQAIWIYR